MSEDSRQDREPKSHPDYYSRAASFGVQQVFGGEGIARPALRGLATGLARLEHEVSKFVDRFPEANSASIGGPVWSGDKTSGAQYLREVSAAASVCAELDIHFRRLEGAYQEFVSSEDEETENKGH